MEFKIGDEVEGITPLAKEHLRRYGNIIVDISESGKFLRFKGRPDNGYRANQFKIVHTIILENE